MEKKGKAVTIGMSNIILHQSLILELKIYKLYVLICITFSSLVKRVFIQIILQTNIILLTAELLRFLARQCVLSFRSYFQYGLMLHVRQTKASTLF